MAISYGNYGAQRSKTIIYYVVATLIVAAGLVIFFYPSITGLKSKSQEENKSQTAPSQEPPQTSVQTAPVKDQNVPQTKDFASVVTEANGMTSPRVAALLQDAQRDITEGKIIAARNLLNDILNMTMEENLREQIKKQMTDLANNWLLSKTVHFGDNLCSTYQVQPGDILSQIGTKYKVPYQFLMKINNISSGKSLKAGQVLKVVNGPFYAIVYRSSFTMDLYLQNTYVKSYKIGLGKEGHETPVGLWRAKIGGKLIKPTWTDPETGKTYHSSDPDYPLGSGWIALEGIDSRTRGIEGIAIHGTNEELSIGTKSSRGCVRLYNGELVELYDMFAEGFSEMRVAD